MIESINVISFILYDHTPNLTTTTSLQSGKVLDEPVSENDENRTKYGNLAQQNNNDTSTTAPSYKPIVPFPHC